MIYLTMSHDGFINDIHPLVRSFIPGEEIEVSYRGTEPGESFFLSVETSEGIPASFEIKDRTKEDRLAMKNELKCTLYRQLSDKLKKELPWGTLSGIRPVRLAMNHLKEGFSEEETVRWMQDYYLAGPEKSSLAVEIAVKEQRIINEINYPGAFSLYIGIPFCPTTCLYCSFPSNAIGKWKERTGDYLDCIEKELLAVKRSFPDRNPVTVYIGGGTPVTLSEEELKRLFSMTADIFNLSSLKEYTVEAGRPDAITYGKLKVLKENGVDRISVNPQTMNEETLKKIGRFHTVADTVRAFHEARDEGFDNINMDMILGLPDEDLSHVERTISGIAELQPDDLTIHCLAVKRGSALKEHMDRNGYSCSPDTDRMMEAAGRGAEKMGLSPYYLYRQKNMSGNFENTGWSKPGKEGLYNILMMEEVQSIAAVGAGTVSKYVGQESGDISRYGTPKDLNSYFGSIDEIISKKEEFFRKPV
ncbi:MAG: coproporphyrinogen dehydrogenase HemZ [Lachnospiraceae bacterium]|nr:coproporphyrinogen dehydrogenase HemZ [Lachnospiraceae bacterium]